MVELSSVIALHAHCTMIIIIIVVVVVVVVVDVIFIKSCQNASYTQSITVCIQQKYYKIITEMLVAFFNKLSVVPVVKFSSKILVLSLRYGMRLKA